MFDVGTLNQSFNTQPPEGGWGIKLLLDTWFLVSTHSRLKAAGKNAKKRRPKY